MVSRKISVSGLTVQNTSLEISRMGKQRQVFFNGLGNASERVKELFYNRIKCAEKTKRIAGYKNGIKISGRFRVYSTSILLDADYPL